MSNIDNEERLAMQWRSSLKFSHLCKHSLVKCCHWPIVAGNDSMDLQLDECKIDNERKACNVLREPLQIFTSSE
jgi:hypothetical protein